MLAGIPNVYIWISLAGVFVAGIYLFRMIQIARRRTQVVRFKLRRASLGLLLYLGGAIVWVKLGHSPVESIFVGFLLGLAGGFFFVRPPRQDRRIPAHVKRAVIVRDLKGEPFNSNVHHIHHVVPFSKGGDNSVRNLKVVTKDKNFRLGSKMPKLRDLL